MSQIDPQRFVETMTPVVRQCAQASAIFYGRVANLGKTADTSLIGQLAQDASSAFTAIDSAIQDIILSVALPYYSGVTCIAEENTPFKRRFSNRDSDYAIILDPIDGTLHFQKGDGPYHVSLGLAYRGVMIAAIVARPTEDKVFTAIRGNGAYVQRGSSCPRRLRLPPTAATNRAFISSKARPFQKLCKQRLVPRERPIGAALVLTQLAEGEICAYLPRQVEVHDVGPPSLIAEEAGATCFLRRGGPRYRTRRKVAFYMAAADADLKAFLLGLTKMPNGSAQM